MTNVSSPFHVDEVAAQRLAGSPATGAGVRAFMPDQHRTFFEALTYVFLATTGADGWPIATMLAGDAGFIRSPDPVTLRIAAAADPRDPAASTLVPGEEIGLLGLDLATRRRNRANGRIAGRDGDGWTVAVRQSFGNCAKYIQSRTVAAEPRESGAVETLGSLDREAQRLISGADTFFAASQSRADIGAAGGVDISHRGGRPGFVDVTADALTIPDYPGNRYYNTLGNLLGDPRAALLFLDFESGDLLQLQGIVNIDWDASRARLIAGALRTWRFTVTRGWRRRAACPLRWRFVDYSAATLKTGTWRPVAPDEASAGGADENLERSLPAPGPAPE
jgi:uncharacterized protein